MREQRKSKSITLHTQLKIIKQLKAGELYRKTRGLEERTRKQQAQSRIITSAQRSHQKGIFIS